MESSIGTFSGGRAPQRPTVTVRLLSGVFITSQKLVEPVEIDLTQSQTIEGDSHSQHHDENSDDNTYVRRLVPTPFFSVEEEINSFHSKSEASSRHKGKRRQRSTRYILISEEYENEVILTNEAENGAVLVTIQTTQDFQRSAVEASKE